jgi:hypothetical protein
MVDDAAGGRKCFSGAAILPPITTILLPAAQPNIWTSLHIRPRPLCWLFTYAVSRARRRDRRVVVVLGVADLASDLRSDAGETYVAGRATPRASQSVGPCRRAAATVVLLQHSQNL